MSGIKQHLNQVFEALIVQNPRLAEFRRNLYFAGGCIRSLREGNEPKDYDIFVNDVVVIEFINDLCAEGNLNVTGQTFNAINFNVLGRDVQIITLESKEPMAEIKTFDFTMNMNYFVPSTGELYIYDSKAIEEKSLIINFHCRNPFDTFFRIQKFVDRGYEVKDLDEMRKIAVRLTQLEAITTKEGFVEHSRMVGSGMLEPGNLSFLE